LGSNPGMGRSLRCQWIGTIQLNTPPSALAC
jgi:hypothetical protein